MDGKKARASNPTQDRRGDGHGRILGNMPHAGGERIGSFSFITSQPNQLCAELHNRMPVVLKPEAWRAWLGEAPADVRDLEALLGPYPLFMICWPVSARVGNVNNNDLSIIEPISSIS
jgi:putative SOS response-associated peptidase YedK